VGKPGENSMSDRRTSDLALFRRLFEQARRYWMHLLLIFGIALLVFGPKKLPELGKGIGEGIRGFKSALTDQQKPVVTSTNVIEHKS